MEGIKSKDKILKPVFRDKMTHLAYHCVIMNELMDKFYEKIDMSDVICEKCSKINGKINKDKFEKYQSVLNPQMQPRIFLQIYFGLDK